jgi:hypothetical protein
VDPDVLSRPGAAVEQGVPDPIGSFVELRVREAPLPGDEREAVGNGVDDALEEICEVELHRAERT